MMIEVPERHVDRTNSISCDKAKKIKNTFNETRADQDQELF